MAELAPIIRRYAVPEGLTAWPPVPEWTPELWAHWMRGGGYSEARIQRYLTVERDPFLGFAVATLKGKPGHQVVDRWLYVPTPKQAEAHGCGAANLFYGGARGGAKSKWLRQEMYRRCVLNPGYQALVLRRTFPELERSHMIWAARELPFYGGELVGEIGRFRNGSRLEFGHAQDMATIGRYLSAEYYCIGIDEAPTFPKDMVLELAGSVRAPQHDMLGMLRLTGNPAGAHTQWLVDRFIDRVVSRDEDPYYVPEEWAFIQARLYDNPYLMDPDGTFGRYEARLGMLSPEKRAQWMDGDWSALQGQFFSEFRRDLHVRAVAIPEGTVFERTVDWGYNAPGVCLWVACLPDKRLYVAHEYVFTQTLAEDVARAIVEQTKALGAALGYPVRVRKTVADRSMFNKTGATSESIAETFGRCGVVCQASDSQRELGWQRLRAWLAMAPDGLPWLVIDPSCRYLVRSLPSLVSDEHHVEDVNSDGDDHGADALRYLVMARPSPTLTTVPREVPVGSIRWLKERFGPPDRLILGAESVRR